MSAISANCESDPACDPIGDDLKKLENQETYESIKAKLYFNLEKAKESSWINEEALEIIEDELNRWCGTPPNIPEPWNTDTFLSNIGSTLAAQPRFPGGEKLGAREIIRIAWEIIKPTTAEAPTHDGHGNVGP